MINLRRDLHPQESAHAGRTKKTHRKKQWVRGDGVDQDE
ncbi:hypothetical protein BLL52_4112 [Rhodoferax antarcticus ANT.BR]|uniref:Uncharacterized protein n=1 Tax=Rhodoferax antarcticus ANT.BR TaxID=1111071 RepID=A0A1Q8Y9G0_9BURK|nr:hypothetical protein BLL52_4112 [Rhodoferax antarcticus ANT.BR]